MTADRRCRWCGEPLPPLSGRGRPRVAHPGECARQDRNRAQLDARFRRYRAASSRFLDRSDDVPWIASLERDEAAELEDAFEPVLGPFGPVYGPGALHSMWEWERMETARRKLARMLWEGSRAQLDGTPPPVGEKFGRVGPRTTLRLFHASKRDATESEP